MRMGPGRSTCRDPESTRSPRAGRPRPDPDCAYAGARGVVLELDRRELGSTGLFDQLGSLVALPRVRRTRHDLVLDPHVVQCLLDAPAGMPADFHPLPRAAEKPHSHGPTISPKRPTGGTARVQKRVEYR